MGFSKGCGLMIIDGSSCKQKGWFFLLLSLVLLIVQAGCASVPGSRQSESGWRSIADQDYADVFIVDPPVGWVMLPQAEVHSALIYQLVPEGSDGSAGLRVNVQYHRPSMSADDLLLGADDPARDGIAKFRDRSGKDAAKFDTISDVRVISDLNIGGVSAVGYSYLSNREFESNTPVQIWLLWRHDGMWEFAFYGSGDVVSIPQGLVDALRDARWTCGQPTSGPESCCVAAPEQSPDPRNCK